MKKGLNYKKHILFFLLIFWLELCNAYEIKKEPPDPGKTGLIAFTFGFVIHGAGHLYIDEKVTSVLLFGGELASIITGTVGSEYWGKFTCIGDNLRWSEKEKCIYAMLSPILFWGTWFYDIFASPIKASKMRKEYEEKKKEKQIAPELGFIPAKDFKGGSLALTWRF